MKKIDESKIKWLEFVQNIIARNNTNSFQIKFMHITLITAILAIYLDKKCELILLLAIFITFVFWFLDAKYLQQERRFRGLYNDIIKSKKNIEMFSMPIDVYKGGKYNYFSSCFSCTIFPLYFIVICVSIVLLIMEYNNIEINHLIEKFLR